MSRRPGLGKGLDALIPTSTTEEPKTSGGVVEISVDQIQTNPHQPRTTFNGEQLNDLAASIKEHGVIQPLIVTQGDSPEGYTLIAGERRLQAARLANLDKVPVIVREATEQELLLLALIENVQRADLSPLETAEAYKHLSEQFKFTQEQIADRVGKSRVAVTNTMSLLDLSPAVRQALADGEISEGHARALKGLSRQSQSNALQTVINKGLNVRQAEELARKLKGVKAKKPPKAEPSLTPELEEMQAQLRDYLGTKVNLKYSSKGGTVTIKYYSDEELNALVDKLLKQ
ncbi:MAG: ParB/RepB/Spo0J family partition protein [Chloroflexota bacterium]